MKATNASVSSRTSSHRIIRAWVFASMITACYCLKAHFTSLKGLLLISLGAFSELIDVTEAGGRKSRTITLAIVHREHEGSHAIVHALTTLPCVFSLRESLDYGKNGVPNIHHFVTAGEEISSEKYAAYGWSYALTYSLDKAKRCEAEAKIIVMAGLYRWRSQEVDEKNFSLMKKGLLNPLFKLVFLFRTDYLRYSISLSKSEEEHFGTPHPQFQHKNHKGKIKIAPHHVSLESLEKARAMIVSDTLKSLAQMKRLITDGYVCGEKIRYIMYEQFMLDPYRFTDQLYSFAVAGIWYGQDKISANGNTIGTTNTIERGGGGALPRTIDFYNPNTSEFKKIHPTDISEFIINANEVMDMFMLGGHPTFGHLLREAALPCNVSRLSLYSD